MFIYYLHVICLSITNDSNGYKKFEYISCFVGGMNIKSKCFTSVYNIVIHGELIINDIFVGDIDMQEVGINFSARKILL